MADGKRIELSRVAGYGLAVALTCGALLVRGALPLGPGLGIYPLTLAIVVLSAWYAGRGPAWVATFISAVGARYFFIHPTHTLAIDSLGTAVGLALFLTVALLLIEFSMARRRAEQALAESESRLRLMAENVPEMLWIADVEAHQTLYVSPSYEHVWGRPASDIYRDTNLWLKAIHPEDRARVSATYAKWLTSDENVGVDLEYRIIRPDGTMRWIHDRGALIKDGPGKAFRASGIAEDVTERKEIEQKLRTSEEHWKQVFENNPTMYFLIDAAGTVVSVNPFGAEQLGYRVDELVGRPVLSVFHLDDRERAQQNVASCLKEIGKAHSWELRKVRKDGTIIWVRETARAVAGMDQAPIVLIACEDITQAKVAGEELRYRTQQLASITDNMMSMLQLLDPEGRVIFVNPATERISGYRGDELVGHPPHEKLHHSHPDGTPYPASECPLSRSVQAVKPIQCEDIFVRKDGSFFPVFCSCSPIIYEGVLRGFVTEVQDMTERKRAEQALAQMQTELAHVTRVTAMGEMAASIAHDVNQPLAAIVTNGHACLRWLAGKPPNLDEARLAVERIVQQGTRAAEIISGIRALLKKSPSKKESIDLNRAITEIVAITRAEAQRRRVKLEMHLSPDVPPIHGDRVQLQQVVFNLILNGVEATSAVRDGPRELVVSSENDPRTGVLVSFRDTGVGFENADPGRLFDPFYTTKQGGMGMGLAISRSIIESHRGRIWATANSPRGAVFGFALPATARPP